MKIENFFRVKGKIYENISVQNDYTIFCTMSLYATWNACKWYIYVYIKIRRQPSDATTHPLLHTILTIVTYRNTHTSPSHIMYIYMHIPIYKGILL